MDEHPGSEHPPCAPVTVEYGLLSGLRLPNSTRVFRGVPYGAPPVGDLRWRPPQRLLPWEGVRPATRFGPSSFQFPPPATSLYFGGETEFSEDCLYLNIWTGPEGTHNRPVLVWFHFGAFLFGSGSNPMYDGTKMAADGITVVTVNYRLGRFGFLAHPELSDESGYQGSGNYGIMDQIAALEWVQRNIKAFGGDPGNVTIGGASAGGGSVHILRSSPLAKLLFSKAICESGPGVAPTINGPGHVAAFTTLAAAEKAGVELLDFLGVSSVAELRKMPAENIVAVHLARTQGPWKSDLWPGSTSLSVFDTANPIVDGHVLPESPLNALLSDKAADVPMLAGNVGNEASGLPHLGSLADYHIYVNETFGEHAEDVRRLYPATTDQEVRTSTSQLLADQVFVWPTWTSARLQVRKLKSPVWYYKFLRAPPIPPDSNLIERKFAGAFHVAGVPYAFGNLDAWKWDWTDADRALSKNVSNAWARFMRTGRPDDAQSGKEHANSWPALNSSYDLIKIWDDESRLETPGSRVGDVAAFWDRYYGIKDHVTTEAGVVFLKAQ
ncbi:para-nitrobenzyl esterase [Lentithecium fluviatile CBS 122367]|uniref:Carboxylic ester hydrolase n=1 Tax=Lentithecium fluviatile CBS 122367 TaxID=1168545 RepID=A0A6G1JJ17_9PLEO|nr:para-nitrobenzyl esterase [Lentithecium fluviatile CBS 122367]